PGVLHLTRRIAQAKADPKVQGLVLDLRGVSAGLGQVQELRQAVEDFRSSGKTAIAYTYNPSMGEYYLATACEKVILHPSGSLDIKGVAYATTFFKGLLDKLGIRPQF